VKPERNSRAREKLLLHRRAVCWTVDLGCDHRRLVSDHFSGPGRALSRVISVCVCGRYLPNEMTSTFDMLNHLDPAEVKFEGQRPVFIAHIHGMKTWMHVRRDEPTIAKKAT